MFESDGGCQIEFHRFRGSYFPTEWSSIKDCMEALKHSVDPDLIFTHFLHDRHQDHRTVAELTWNTFRDHQILEYEISKFEGDLANPNVYFPLAIETMERKVSTLMQCFPSQQAALHF